MEMMRVPAGVKETIIKCSAYERRIAIIFVIAIPFTCEEGMYGMVEVIIPLCCYSVTAPFPFHHYPWIVEIALGDDCYMSVLPPCKCVCLFHQFLQNVFRRCINNAVHGIKAKAVEAVFIEPVERIVKDESPHGIAVRTVKVQRFSPGSRIPFAQKRSEHREAVAHRTYVVVDDIQNSGHSFPVAFGNQAPEVLRPSVTVLWCIEKHAIVSPVPFAVELGDRHELDSSYTDF
ncbi:MAG: hypothetical protein M1117_05220 [Candidatus Thermoplasmatota archaeon]|nr:hypothetical protein [Candidatus Thermoplasmatota archaeon]